MASHRDTIVIPDDEEVPSVEPRSSRFRKTPRHDYSYQNFQKMVAELVDDEAETTTSRKRKRTEMRESSKLVRVPRQIFSTF